MELVLFIGWIVAACLTPLGWNLWGCWPAVLNDARVISRDPALQLKVEIMFAYPGFWALFWYRLSHALLQQEIPVLSHILPRLVMSLVRYCTAIDIHPAAKISEEGVFIDHGAGLVVGATAVIGAGVTLYHGVTLGNSGKKLSPGVKRHPTIGDRVVIGAGAKILGDIEIGDDVLVGANSVLTKPVPANHTAVGVPARVLCHGVATGKDVAGAAICELHKRLVQVERKKQAPNVTGERRDAARYKRPQEQIQQQQPAGEGLELWPLVLPSPEARGQDFQHLSWASPSDPGLSSPLSQGLEKKRQEELQEERQKTLSLGSSRSPLSPELAAVDQILYSQEILSAAA